MIDFQRYGVSVAIFLMTLTGNVLVQGSRELDLETSS